MTNSAFNLLLAASVAGLAGTAAAETKGIILDNADNSQVAVSIYNNDLAFVRDSRTAELAAGRNSVAFKGVAEKIMPETAMLVGNGIKVTEQNYNYNLLTPVNIINESVGKTVKTALYNEKTGTTSFDEAKILDSNYGNPILQFSYGIETIRNSVHVEHPKGKHKTSLTDLDNHTCRWPVGDPKDENFHFCGRKIKIGQTYCEEHAAIAYVKATGKK